MVTKAYLANGKDGYDVLAKCNQVCEKIPDLMQEKSQNGKTYLEQIPKMYKIK